MTKKINPDLTKRELLIKSWKNRKDYKGYDRSKGSSFNSWRAIINTKKSKLIGYPKEWRDYNVFMSEVQGIWNKGKICVRLDTSKSHGCDNSMWANKGVENFGKLINFEYNGEIKTLIEWSKQYNLNYNGVRQRYFKGKNYTSEEILFGKQITNMKRNITDIKKLEKQKQRDKVSKMLSAYRLKDKKKGLQTDIDFEWTFNIISNSKCIYCENTENIGLDRIDNLKGHTKNNVVPCCYICNTTRNNNFSFEEMKIMGKIIKEIHLCRLKNLNY